MVSRQGRRATQVHLEHHQPKSIYGVRELRPCAQQGGGAEGILVPVGLAVRDAVYAHGMYRQANQRGCFAKDLAQHATTECTGQAHCAASRIRRRLTYVRTYVLKYARSVHTQSIQPRAQDCLRDRPRAQSGFSSSRVSKNDWVSSPPVCASKSAATCLACS